LVKALENGDERVQDIAFSALARVCEKLSIRKYDEYFSRFQVTMLGTIGDKNPKKTEIQTNKRCYHANFREKRKNSGDYP